MTGWPKIPLADCCEIISGATPSTSEPSYWNSGDICWATPKDLSELDGPYISDTPRKLTAAGLASCAATVLPEMSVLFSSRAPIGHVAINTVPMATNQGFKSFIPKANQVHAKFLYHWLRRNRPYLESLGNGATFKEVSKAVVARVEIPVPPFPEQCRIAEILDKADALRARRRAAIAQLDTLTQAIFLDMFGDPTTNPRGWPTRSLAQIGEVVTGNTPSRGEPDYFDGTLEWIKSDNLSAGAYFATRAEETLSDRGRAVARTAPPTSILVTCIAGSENSIGNAAMVNREVAFNQQINALIPRSGNPHFLFGQMRIGKRLVQQASTASMKGMVSKRRFQEIQFVFPPIEDQDRFAAASGLAERFKSAQRASLGKLDALFASLQDRAFRGEL